jgi:hypothetical protein
MQVANRATVPILRTSLVECSAEKAVEELICSRLTVMALLISDLPEKTYYTVLTVSYFSFIGETQRDREDGELTHFAGQRGMIPLSEYQIGTLIEKGIANENISAIY